MSAPLSIALAQLVVLESQQVEQLADTRAAIAAIERIAGRLPTPSAPPVRASTHVPAPKRHETPRAFPASAVLLRGHRGSAAAAGRAHAVLRLIADGTRTGAGLCAAVPIPPGMTAHQHKKSIANALTRLGGKGLVQHGTDGWTLTATGRRAAGAAKGEP